MRKKASISVFLALICLCIISVIMISLESARTTGARWQAQMIASSSLDSLFSEYNTGLWKDYGLALLEYVGDEDLKGDLFEYASSNTENISNYRLSEPYFDIKEKKMILDEGGAYLEREIVDFMKYAPLDITKIFEDPNQILKEAKSATSGADISNDLANISKIAMDLEKQAKTVSDTLADIGLEYSKALKDIENRNISTFIDDIEELSKKIDALQKQFIKYKKIAKKTKEKIEKAARDKSEYKDLGENKDTIEEYSNAYDLYNEEQAKRLEELEKIVSSYKDKKIDIKEARNIADNIKDLEDSNDEENDYSSEIDELYADLDTLFRNLGINANLSKTEVDEEKKNILLELKDSIDKGLLSLVLPKDKELSNLSIEKVELPSSASIQNTRSIQNMNLFSRVLCLEYMDRFFNDYSDEKINILAYEKEYLVAGEETDEKNLAQTVEKLLLLRAGLNYISIIKDKNKLSEVKILANLIMGACALPHLAFLLEFFILSLWSMAEAVADIKCLLAGGKIPILKFGKDFKISLNSLFNFSHTLENIEVEKESKKAIFTYHTYLKILLLLEKQEKINYRILDLVEVNEQKRGNNIKMKDMLYALDVDMNIKSSRLFSDFVYEGNRGLNSDFSMRIQARKAY